MKADAVRRLCAVLERENAALAGLDFAAVAGCAAEKAAALAALGPPGGALGGAPGGASGGARGPADAEAVRALDAAVRENRRRLEHALAVQGRIIALVARAAPAARGSAYGTPARSLRPAAHALVARV